MRPVQWLRSRWPSRRLALAALALAGPVRAQSGSPGLADSLAGVPLVVQPATAPGGRTMAVLLTGDGGWAGLDRQIARTLAAHGIPTVALETPRYFRTRRTPDEAAEVLRRIIERYTSAWGRDSVLLVGYSHGADVLPFLARRLPPPLLDRAPVIAMVGLARGADFDFHLLDVLRTAPSGHALPVLPELAHLRGRRMVCIYGADDRTTLCPALDSALVTPVRYPGGHRMTGLGAAVAERILAAAASR